MLRTAFNSSDSPIVVDDDGHQIGGGEWGTADSTFDGVKAAAAAGTLVWVDVDTEAGDVDRDAKAAGERTADLRDRHDRLSDLEPGDLHKIAVKEGLLAEGDDPPTKTRLVAQLAHSGAPIPASKAQRGQTGANKPKEA